MATRNFITFECDCPEGTYSPSGDILVPAGLPVAKLIQGALCKHGFQATDPAQHSYYGWLIEVAGDKRAFKILLQESGPWLLICEYKTSSIWHPFRNNDDLLSFVENLAALLAEVPDISSLSLLTRTEFEASQRRKSTAVG